MTRWTLGTALVGVIIAAVLGGTSCGRSSESVWNAPGGERRIVTDIFGPVEVPASPQRVVELDENVALSLLAVGIEPIAVFQGWGSVPAAVVLREEGIEVLPPAGGMFVPSAEQVLALEPDLLVVAGTESIRETITHLEGIAPVLHVPNQDNWRTVVDFYGRASIESPTPQPS